MTKKVAITSVSLRILLDESSARSICYKYLEQYLKNEKGYEVDFVSKKIKHEESIENYKHCFDMDNFDEYDEIYLYTSQHNFFGGVVFDFTTNILEKLLKYKGKINLVLSDLNIPHFNFVEKLYNKRDKLKLTYPVTFTEQDVETFKNLNYEYLFFSLDVDVWTKYMRSKTPSYFIDVQTEKYEIYPIEAIIFANRKIEIKSDVEKKYDICYYGANRQGDRQKKLKKYFEKDQKLHKLFVGLDFFEFPNSEMFGAMKLNELYSTIQQSYSSIVIGESMSFHLSYRFFENIKNGLVSFVDIGYDPNKTLYKDQWLKDNMYVSSIEEIYPILDRVKKDKDFREMILQKQFDELKVFDKYNYHLS